jgi:hypothetical protein
MLRSVMHLSLLLALLVPVSASAPLPLCAIAANSPSTAVTTAASSSAVVLSGLMSAAAALLLLTERRAGETATSFQLRPLPKLAVRR